MPDSFPSAQVGAGKFDFEFGRRPGWADALYMVEGSKNRVSEATGNRDQTLARTEEMRSTAAQAIWPGAHGARSGPARVFGGLRPGDLEIVAGLRSEDPEALERLVERYGPMIWHWARSEGAEAEDVVQDVLFRVWKSGHRLDPETSLPGFLKTVTANTIRNRWRAAERRPTVPVGLEPAAKDAADPIGARTDLIAVEQLLRTLSPREREVLRLLYVSDLPLEEVAWRLQASREAVKSLAARARRHVRAEIEKALGTHDGRRAARAARGRRNVLKAGALTHA